MNLKMDDLLANVGKNETYQMLSDFSVLTGDPDPLSGYSGTGRGNKSGGRKRSTDIEKLRDDEWEENETGSKADNDDEMNGGDEDEDDDDDDDVSKKKVRLRRIFVIIY